MRGGGSTNPVAQLTRLSPTAAEGPNFRGTWTVGTTFIHMARIVLRDL